MLYIQRPFYIMMVKEDTFHPNQGITDCGKLKDQSPWGNPNASKAKTNLNAYILKGFSKN